MFAGVSGKMKEKTLRLAAAVCLAVSAALLSICINQAIRLSRLEKTAAAETSKLEQAQSQIGELKKELAEKEKPGGNVPTAAARKFSYDAKKVQGSGPKIAYLTFDDGPTKNTPLLLSTLKSLNVRATFFVVGVNCQKFPDAVRQEASAGHAVGIHSWTHQYSYIYASMTDFMQDFNRLRNYVTQQLGREPDICRFPGGTNNTVSLRYGRDHIMRQVVRQVESMNIRPIDWNVSPEDAVERVPSSGTIVRRVIRQTGGQHRPVILLHDLSRSTNTVNAVPQIVRSLRVEGYSFGILTAETQAVMFEPS